MRPGFTLVETLVALMIAAIAIVALAGTAALVASRTGEGAQLTRAAHRARSILDSLASRPCAAAIAGTDTSSALPAEWRVTPAPGSIVVDVVVRTAGRRSVRLHTLRSTFACERRS